jgi:rsbT co-antagonist protein RsbR
LNQFHLAMESLAGLAQALMAQGKLAEALTPVEEILTYLEEHSLDGAEEPVRVYLTCYHVLQANQDPRAEAILNTGGRLLRKRAAKVNDKDLRQSFLENVAVHREVLESVSEWQARLTTLMRETAHTQDGAKADKKKAKAQLVDELANARRRISELEILAAELQQAEETLWEGENRFQSIAATASDAIIIFDTYENIFFWNRAAQEIFGYQAGEAQGKLLASILSEKFHERFRREMERVIATGESELIGQTIEAAGIRKDGSAFPLELSVGLWKTKEETFFTAIGRDVSDRKQAEAELQQAYAEVQTLVEEQTAELRREVAERERLQQEVIEAQRRALQELSTPIIPIMDRIIVMPLIGGIDTLRARDITRALLAGIREHRAKVVILDITGVPIIDSGIASHMNKTIQAARLKGALTIVTGVSDAVAETVVDLGIDWEGIETLADLQTGLVAALQNLGIRLAKQGATKG